MDTLKLLVLIFDLLARLKVLKVATLAGYAHFFATRDIIRTLSVVTRSIAVVRALSPLYRALLLANLSCLLAVTLMADSDAIVKLTF